MLSSYLRAAFLFQVTTKWAFSLAPSHVAQRSPFTVGVGYNKVTTAFTTRKISSSSSLFAGNDDDFFSDYDPSQYESFNKPSYNDDQNSYGRGGYGGGGGYGRERGGGGYGRGGGGGRGRGGRGGSRNFVYSRDTSRDNSNVDEGAIIALLDQRSQAKKTRDFETADAIRDDLLQNYSVGVDDRERTWRTGCSSSGSGMRFGGGGGRERGGGGRRQRDFGPNGHDYILSPDAGESTSSFSEAEIHAMLAERLQAKMNRDFSVADSIQIDLINEGVFVHDGMKEWRADGTPFGDIGGGRGPGRTRGSYQDRNRAYEKSIHSGDVEGADDEMITRMVMERAKFKVQQNYDKADAVREGLRTKFNVIVDDRLREWSVNGDFGEEHNLQRQMAEQFASRGYIKSTSSEPIDEADEETIQAMVTERAAFKADRNYEEADAIREDLNYRFDVVINDKMKEWSVGGSFGGANNRNRAYELSQNSAPVDEADAKVIIKALKERSRCKKVRDFETADAIREELREKYNVMIDDREKEWRVNRPDFNSNRYDNDVVEEQEEPLDEDFEAEMSKLESVLSDEISATVSEDTEEEEEVEEEGAEEESASLSTEALSSLTVVQLKEKLREGGLPVSGKKSELVERLLASSS
jgi:cysteinyl-tRNA synthetase